MMIHILFVRLYCFSSPNYVKLSYNYQLNLQICWTVNHQFFHIWRRCHAFLQERIQKSQKKQHVQKWLSCAILRGRAQKDVLQLTRKKRTKSRDQKMFDVPEIKNYLSITLSGATWMALMATQFAPLQFKKIHHRKKFVLFLFFKFCWRYYSKY